jgi:simple sugar transport system permease protein
MSEVVALALLLATVRVAVPLALAALGELVAERAGVINIGIEGMMLIGAFAAYAAGVLCGSAPLAVAAAGIGGVAAAAIFGAFVLGRGADPIVCGTALNLIALGATGTSYGLLIPPDELVPEAPLLGDWLDVPIFVWLTAGAALAVAILLTRARVGLTIRAVGEHAAAAHAQGISVLRVRWACTLLGGLLAGIAGSTLVLWITTRFVESTTAGRGFIALALVLFGGYSVPRILLCSALFGIAYAVQFQLQAREDLRLSPSLLLMLPYVLTLLALALRSTHAKAPADLGRPFPSSAV